MSIPIKNIYYLLSYAWDKGKIEGWSRGEGQEAEALEMSGLLAIMLTEALGNSRTLPQSHEFRSKEAIYPGIKGKLQWSQSLKKNLISQGKALVQFDTLQRDELYLRIIKSTWERIRAPQNFPLPPSLATYSLIPLSPHLFPLAYRQYAQPQIRYLIRICEWIYHKYVPSISEGGITLQNFFLNSHEMPALFEAFIRNFYRRHARHYDFVGRERLQWIQEGEHTHNLLPRMETDVSLISPSRKLIVETKFYKEALQRHYRSTQSTFHSKHLYQIFAYLSHAGNSPDDKPCEGLLIYPTVDLRLDEHCMLNKHPIRICTLDLNRPWEEIHEELLEWVG